MLSYHRCRNSSAIWQRPVLSTSETAASMTAIGYIVKKRKGAKWPAEIAARQND
jgi:hypothetical protein